MKAYEKRYSPRYSLTSALYWGERSASRPGRLTPKQRAPDSHWIGGWVGPRTVLDAVVKRNIPSPRRESNHGAPIVQPVAQRYTDWAIMALRRHFLLYKIRHGTGSWNARYVFMYTYYDKVGIHFTFVLYLWMRFHIVLQSHMPYAGFEPATA
jgi:hypothetical protein